MTCSCGIISAFIGEQSCKNYSEDSYVLSGVKHQTTHCLPKDFVTEISFKNPCKDVRKICVNSYGTCPRNNRTTKCPMSMFCRTRVQLEFVNQNPTISKRETTRAYLSL